MKAEIERMDSDERKCLLEDKGAMLTEIEGMGSDEHRRLIKQMEAMLERAKQPKLEPNCCIYKVPQRMRERNPIAYTPKVVSIGPLHDGHKKLKPMEELKLGYLKSYLERSSLKLEECIEKLKKKEEYIRSCYDENISQNSDDFVKTILIDACFIIEYFFRYIEFEYPLCDDQKTNDPIVSKPSRVFDMKRDLMLLENQLPFLVLDALFTPTCRDGTLSSFLEVSFFYLCSSYHNYSTFNPFDLFENVELQFKYFQEYYLQKRELNGVCEKVEVQHLTDFLRILFLPCHKLQPKGAGNASLKYSASQLLEAGLKFKVVQNRSLVVLQFEKGVLTMPKLMVDYDTETLLRNMAALEQCHYPEETNIVEYVGLLDFLINEAKMLTYLLKKEHWKTFLGKAKKLLQYLTISAWGRYAVIFIMADLAKI